MIPRGGAMNTEPSNQERLPPATTIFEVEAEVTDLWSVEASSVQLILHAPAIAATCKPGQFVMVRCADGYDPLLPRPFTVYQADREGGDFHILVKNVGRGSAWLQRRRKGDRLQVTGPLGHGFTIPAELSMALLIGGGTGTAALGLLAAELTQRGSATENVSALIGAHTRGECICVGHFGELCGDDGVRLWITRDGLEKELDRLSATLKDHHRGEGGVHVFAAGPHGMLRRVTHFAATHCLPCQVSVEAKMACGVGVCQSCICRQASGKPYLLVCADGPVFDSRAVRL